MAPRRKGALSCSAALAGCPFATKAHDVEEGRSGIVMSSSVGPSRVIVATTMPPLQVASTVKQPASSSAQSPAAQAGP